MRRVLSVPAILFFLLFGCATTPKEKPGPLTGKLYDCRKPEDAAEYEKECKKDKRIKCMAKLSVIAEFDRHLIEEGRIAIGMTKEEVRCSYGPPEEIKRSELRGGTFEQWIYGSHDDGFVFLYFQDDVLISSHNG